jgi:hypothetical protein
MTTLEGTRVVHTRVFTQKGENESVKPSEESNTQFGCLRTEQALGVNDEWFSLQEKRNSLRLSIQTPWPLVRKGTIPTERQPLVGEI